MKPFFKEITQATGKTLPVVQNEKTFSAREYGEAVGLGVEAARRRIRTMIADGLVRHVRTYNKDGVSVPAFEWLGKR